MVIIGLYYVKSLGKIWVFWINYLLVPREAGDNTSNVEPITGLFKQGCNPTPRHQGSIFPKIDVFNRYSLLFIYKHIICRINKYNVEYLLILFILILDLGNIWHFFPPRRIFLSRELRDVFHQNDPKFIMCRVDATWCFLEVWV